MALEISYLLTEQEDLVIDRCQRTVDGGPGQPARQGPGVRPRQQQLGAVMPHLQYSTVQYSIDKFSTVLTHLAHGAEGVPQGVQTSCHQQHLGQLQQCILLYVLQISQSHHLPVSDVAAAAMATSPQVEGGQVSHPARHPVPVIGGEESRDHSAPL